VIALILADAALLASALLLVAYILAIPVLPPLSWPDQR